MPHSIQADSFLAMGNAPGSNGKLVLDQFDWTSTSATLVGVCGTGELEIRHYGGHTSYSGSLGIDASGHGTATVDGSF